MSICPVHSHSLVCSEKNTTLYKSSLCLSRIPSKHFTGDINLVHLPKVEIKYCKIQLKSTSWTKYSFWDVDLFGITSVFVNISF